ncbi:MAG TPA: hypothetical protein VGH22_00720 [Candidatus Binatia bacterium]|jgi:hypothetical protein
MRTPHVIESEQTWSYISDEKLKPYLIQPGGARPQNWLVDGRVFNRGVNINRELPEAIREMRDNPLDFRGCASSSLRCARSGFLIWQLKS